MKNRVNNLLLATVMIAVVFVTACSEDAVELARPTVEISSSNGNGLSYSEATDITVGVVAPGSISTMSATLTGEGTLDENAQTGVDTQAGTISLTYTSSFNSGDAIITVIVVDEQGKTSEASLTITVAAAAPITITESTVSGIWEAGNTYIVNADLSVPEGQSLTIEQGVTVIFEAAAGANYTPQLTVLGDLFCNGTEDNQILFTVPESQRIEANIYAGLWGGIQAAPTSDNVLLAYTAIEYAGGPSPETDVYDEGEFRYGLYFENPEGKLVMDHARISFTTDDGMRVKGASLVIINSTFEANGHEGGESINVKDGTVGVIAFNLFYGSATNGIKFEGFGEGVSQSNIHAYNNTIINAGYRRTKANRGGSINVQEGAKGAVFNNIIANCKYGMRLLEEEGEEPDMDNTTYGNHLYYGLLESMVDEFIVTVNNLSEKQDSDIMGLAKENDLLFANYDLNSYEGADEETTIDNIKLATMNDDMDFHLQSSSPGLNAGYTDFTPLISTITVGEYTVSVPNPASYIGAFGQ